MKGGQLSWQADWNENGISKNDKKQSCTGMTHRESEKNLIFFRRASLYGTLACIQYIVVNMVADILIYLPDTDDWSRCPW